MGKRLCLYTPDLKQAKPYSMDGGITTLFQGVSLSGYQFLEYFAKNGQKNKCSNKAQFGFQNSDKSFKKHEILYKFNLRRGEKKVSAVD